MKTGIESIEDWKILHPSFHKESYSATSYRAWAVIVFAKLGGEYILANIPRRGWTVPSGRIEVGETPVDTAVRETWEEIGARIRPEDLRYMGYYLVRDETGGCATVPTYFVNLTNYGDVPEGSESMGTIQCPLEKVRTLYWMWDELIESVFAIAEEYADDKDISN